MKEAAALLITIFCLTPAYASKCGDFNCEPTENASWCPKDCWQEENPRVVWENYHTKAAAIAEFDRLCTRELPCEKTIIGKSIMGRDIPLYRIGNRSAPVVMMLAQQHGWEDCGTETMLRYIDTIRNSSDSSNSSTATNQISKRYVLFVPVINVDSYTRENARRNYTLRNGSVINVTYGVDLNRNYKAGWETADGGTDPTKEWPLSYKGLYRLSEPEAQAVQGALWKYKPRAFIDMHCGNEYAHYVTIGNITPTIQRIIQIGNDMGGNPKGNYDLTRETRNINGTALAEALRYGAEQVWLFEMSDESRLPRNLSMYHEKWWKHQYPIIQGIMEMER